MKKLAIMLSAIIAVSFAGCSDDKPDGFGFDPNNPNAKEHIEYVKEAGEEMGKFLEETEEKNKAEKEDRIENFTDNLTEVSGASLELDDVGKLKVKSYGIEYSELYDADVITIVADFTNSNDGDYDLSFLGFVNYLTLYQDGAVLNMALTDYDYETGTAIKPGKTIEVAFSYMLRDTETDVEIEGTSGDLSSSCSFEIE